MKEEDEGLYPPVLPDPEAQNITSPGSQGRVKYSILAMFLSLAIGFVGNLLYTNKVNNESNHQWCEVLIIASRPLPTSPPPTADQIKGRMLMGKLAREKGCL